MKKISKLKINPSMMLKDQELMQLKGGYDGGSGHTAVCRKFYYDSIITLGSVCVPEGANAETKCKQVYPDTAIVDELELSCTV